MNARRFLFWAMAMELILVVLAVVLARIFLGRLFPWPLSLDPRDGLLGLVAAVPPAVLVGALWLPPLAHIGAVRRMREGILDRLAPILATPLAATSWTGMTGIAVCAGVGEELFFRGLLQSTMGILPSALVFGLFHVLTLSYFLFATAMGLYFSLLLVWSGNLLPVIVAHAAYDVFALYLLRGKLHARAV